VTAETIDTTATDDLSARAHAERLLYRIAAHGESILAAVADPLDIPDYTLDALSRAGKALVQLAVLDATQPAPATVEIVLDAEGDLWVRVGEDQFECRTKHCEDQTLEQVRRVFGVAREFVAAPPGR
jgi:hypothetical protein